MPSSPLRFWTPMEVFWILHLAILVLLHQTVSASDPKKVIGVLGGSVTFRTHNPDGRTALWFFGNEPIVTVAFKDPLHVIFFKDKFKTHFAVSENGLALTISQLRMEDAGTYSVTIGKKRFTFTLQVFKELAEPTVTCEAQNCSGGSCSSSLRCSAPGAGLGNVSYTWDQPWAEGPLLPLNKSSWDKLESLTCTARNPVSSSSVTITSPGVLCAGNSTHPPSPGAHSGSWTRIGAVAGVEIASLLSIFLVYYCKSRGF
ncbi:SLAM family member 7-like isoform X1 [Agelaius phoeniceus]|uniref:SLAM family member 7-like isoform X1 n=1 Tax=Agelaius phoeniceus TaxID=39638 RepID=UPI00405518D0